MKLQDYFSLPFDAKFVMRDGEVDVCQIENLYGYRSIKSYFKRYFWGTKAQMVKLVWFLYENGSRGLSAIKPFLDQFVGFFTTDGYVVYKAYDGENTPNQIRIACLTHIRRGFVNAPEENRTLSMWFIDEFGRMFGNEYEFKKKRYSAERI